jgi:hypothetical protein
LALGTLAVLLVSASLMCDSAAAAPHLKPRQPIGSLCFAPCEDNESTARIEVDPLTPEPLISTVVPPLPLADPPQPLADPRSPLSG